MRIILVRHYKTLINATERIMGWGDAPRVSDWERDLAEVHRILMGREIAIDAVYSSFLERARQTAMYYASRRDIRIIHDAEELNEVNYGSLFRKSKRWVAEHIPEYKTDADFVFPDGESFRQMQLRSVRFISALEHQHEGKTLLVVVHAGVIRGLICHFLDLDFGANLKQEISHQYIGDMVIRGGRCVSYDELGKPSGFVKSAVVRIASSADMAAVDVPDSSHT